MTPSFSNFNITDRGFIHSVLLGNMLVKPIVRSNGNNIFSGKFGLGILFSNWISPISKHVVRIVLMGAPSKMVRINASSISTGVKSLVFSFWRNASRKSKNISVSSNGSLVDVDGSISISSFAERPWDTCSAFGFGNLKSKLNSSSFCGVNFFHMAKNVIRKDWVQE